ncbi:S8 family peptidase [Viridibacterium curvum]
MQHIARDKRPVSQLTRRLAAPSLRPLVVALCAGFCTAQVQAATYAPWLRQIGVSDAILSASNWGTGQLLGVVDTGIVANHPVFASGQVSVSLSGCAAVSFQCSKGVYDDNGHGTAVAEIAAGNRPIAFSTGTYAGYALTAGNVISVAPNANIVAEKVLNASGSGYSTDVANGLRRAADAGARVINVSITYGNTADIVSAINYAASKGAFVVWAGGNSSQNLLSGSATTGLTAQAVSRLVFVGSVNSANALSSFSNKPGAGGIVTTSNTVTSYASRWLMAPGEGIVAPYAPAGTNAWSYWSGTSMSAPIVSGSMILLQSAWPILRTNGTAAQLLLATATDLGAAGTDGSYGMGLVNLATAFKPYGTLTVMQANGKSIAVSSLNGSMITSGALGSLASVQSKLAAYTALDGYARNFSVDLSGLIKSPARSATTNPLPTNVNKGPTAMKLGGGEMHYLVSAPDSAANHLGEFGYNAQLPQARGAGFASFTDARGTSMALGYGYPVQFAYNKALLGDTDAARLADSQGAMNLTALSQGGGFATYGMRLSPEARVALSWSSTAAPASSGAQEASPAWATPSATSATTGFSYQLGESVVTGLSLGLLSEQHGLLGSTYDATSSLSLGDGHHSTSLTWSTAWRISPNNSLLLEAGFARTRAGTASGMFAGTSAIQSRAWGMSFESRHLARKNDRLALSVKQPLRVTSGQVGVVSTSIDDDGVAHYGTEWTSLVPEGRLPGGLRTARQPIRQAGLPARLQAGRVQRQRQQGRQHRDALDHPILSRVRHGHCQRAVPVRGLGAAW